MTVGAYLLSLIDASTNGWVLAGYMFVFGVGMGLVMQVLVVAVQNAVSYQDLGVATSSATFFRMIGGSFGTAVFGAIYAIVLNHTIAPTLAKVPASVLRNFNPQTINPAVLAQAQVDRRGPVLLQQVPRCRDPRDPDRLSGRGADRLRRLPVELPAARGGVAQDGGDGRRRRGERVRRASVVAAGDRAGAHRLSARENRVELYQTLAHRAGIDLPPRSVWLLYRLADQPACTVNDVAQRLKVDPGPDPARGRRAGRGRHDRGTAPGRRVRSPSHASRDDCTREADRGAAHRAHRAPRGLEPRGAPRAHRDGEGSGPLPAGRRRAAAGRRAMRRQGRRRGRGAGSGAAGLRLLGLGGWAGGSARSSGVGGRSRLAHGWQGRSGGARWHRARSARRRAPAAHRGGRGRPGARCRGCRRPPGRGRRCRWCRTRRRRAPPRPVRPAGRAAPRRPARTRPPRRPACRPPHGPSASPSAAASRRIGPARRGARRGWCRCRCR